MVGEEICDNTHTETLTNLDPNETQAAYFYWDSNINPDYLLLHNVQSSGNICIDWVTVNGMTLQFRDIILKNGETYYLLLDIDLSSYSGNITVLICLHIFCLHFPIDVESSSIHLNSFFVYLNRI